MTAAVPLPDPTPLSALPAPPNDVGFPVTEWSVGAVADGLDNERIEALTEGIVTDQPEALGQTLAMLVVHRGQLVVEAYGPGTTAETTLISWSMAKSMLQSVVGMLVLDGRMDINAPAAVGEWDDERSAITVRDLLRMRAGLRWNEDYVDGDTSHVIDMLFGGGAADMGAYAAALPAEHVPGDVWQYSSGTSNILSRIVRNVLGGQAAYESYLRHRLFEPLGMTSAEPKFDDAGTFVGSSYVYATAHDFARYGLFNLRDGVVNGRSLLPVGWVDQARTMHAWDAEDEQGYGEHWWVANDRFGTFFCNGYEGQRIACVPALDLVVVRLGKTPAELGPAWRERFSALISCFEF